MASKHGDGTWRRDYDGGTVVVNPTDAAIEIQFGEDRRDVTSGASGRAFVVPKRDGRILLFPEG